MTKEYATLMALSTSQALGISKLPNAWLTAYASARCYRMHVRRQTLAIFPQIRKYPRLSFRQGLAFKYLQAKSFAVEVLQ